MFASLMLAPVKSYAIQYTFSGENEIRAINLNNADSLSSDIEKSVSYADLRLRLKSDLAINENAKGVVTFETGHTVFGIDPDSTANDGVPGNNKFDLKLKHVYADFFLPGRASNFKVGLQPVNIFNGLLANEDAFGITYQVDAERIFQFNFVKIFDNKANEEYQNEINQQRTSSFLSLFYQNNIFKVDIFNVLFGYYIDKNAIIDNTLYIKRDAYYFGMGYRWKKFGFDYSLDLVYEKGDKKRPDEITGGSINNKSEGYLVDIKAERDFERFNLYFEALLATGDANPDDKKDREYMGIDGLTNFYDRAYIMTGYLTNDDIDERDGLFDNSFKRLTNVVFFKIGSEIKLAHDKRLDISVMYATNDKSVVTAAGNEEDEIGGEVDATLKIDVTDSYYESGKGVVFNLFGAYFDTGKVYEDSDGNKADDVYLLGTGFEYLF